MAPNHASYRAAELRRTRLSNRVAELANQRVPLTTFIDVVSNLDPSLNVRSTRPYVPEAGRIISYFDCDHSFVFGWYNGVIEYAYIS